MSITITEKSKELTKPELYLMTLSPSIRTIKDVPDGTKITVKAYVRFEDSKNDDSVVDILSILTPEKEVYSTQSATFKDAFYNIVECVCDSSTTEFTIVKMSGKSKAGRSFVTCVLDIDSIE